MPCDMASLLGEFPISERETFKKEFFELLRVHAGLDRDYAERADVVEDSLPKFEKIMGEFGEKYPGITIKVRTDSRQVILDVLIMTHDSLKEIFTRAARIQGITALGAQAFDAVSIESPAEVEEELNNVKDRLCLSFAGPGTGSAKMLLQKDWKSGKVKVSYDPEDIVSEKSPDYILIAYYALREGIKKDVDLAKKLSSLGFLVRPLDSDLRKSIDAFNPRFTE